MLYIFDWDGTLVDSLAIIVSSFRSTAAQLNLEVPDENEIRQLIGLNIEDAIEELFPQRGKVILEQIKSQYSTHFKQSDVEKPPVFYTGVKQVLEELTQQGHDLAIATGKSRRGLTRALDNAEDMKHLFSFSRCGDEVFSKPNPQMLNEILDFYGVNADQAVMVGDTEFDMLMAKKINMGTIAVIYGAHPFERLQACNPDVITSNFKEVLNWDWNR